MGTTRLERLEAKMNLQFTRVSHNVKGNQSEPNMTFRMILKFLILASCDSITSRLSNNQIKIWKSGEFAYNFWSKKGKSTTTKPHKNFLFFPLIVKRTRSHKEIL